MENSKLIEWFQQNRESLLARFEGFILYHFTQVCNEIQELITERNKQLRELDKRLSVHSFYWGAELELRVGRNAVAVTKTSRVDLHKEYGGCARYGADDCMVGTVTEEQPCFLVTEETRATERARIIREFDSQILGKIRARDALEKEIQDAPFRVE